MAWLLTRIVGPARARERHRKDSVDGFNSSTWRKTESGLLGLWCCWRSSVGMAWWSSSWYVNITVVVNS